MLIVGIITSHLPPNPDCPPLNISAEIDHLNLPPAVILSAALISMLVLSDGLCPAVAAALAAAAGFVYASTADRFREAA